MILVITPQRSRPHRWLHALPILLYGIIAAVMLRDYIAWGSVNFLIGLAAMPLMTGHPDSDRRTPRRAGWLALGFALICLAMPVSTALYMAVGCAMIFIWEQYRGRLTALPFLTLLMMSPVAQYFAQVFSFPIRLWLTDVAGRLLQLSGLNALATGNIITCNTGEYAVDLACMGLNMLVTSLLCGLIMLAIYTKRAGKRLPLYLIVAGLAGLAMLNVVANLIRIMLLVYFRLLPDNPMHGFTGIICLAVYVLLPGSWLLRRLVRSGGRTQDAFDAPAGKTNFRAHRLHLLILPCMLLAAVRIHNKHSEAISRSLPVVPGYTVSWYDREVIRIADKVSLIYLKPVRGFIYTDHNPLLCWTGSGYGFDSVREQRWSGTPLFTGVLSKGKEKLYTAWWYDNGVQRTTNQLEWRWEMMRGSHPFTIINVTAGDPEGLKKAVEKISVMGLGGR